LNEEASSEQRATVLSFRGLATNLSYGGVSILFSALIVWIKPDDFDGIEDVAQVSQGKPSVFVEALGWFPWYFLVTFLLVILIYRFRFPKKRD
jgi:hypothetical protein